MDMFEIPDDYKPEKPLTDEEADDITNYLKGHPLFMKDVPADGEKNEVFEALQAIEEEGQMEPLPKAELLCKQGSAKYKEKPNNPYFMRVAYKNYTQAINIKPDSPALMAKLHSNRAMINLKFHNYGKVIQDCKICLSYDPTFAKAFYRMAKAYISTKKFKECIDLLSNKTEPELKDVLKEAITLKENNEKLAKLTEEKLTMTSNEIREYFQLKGWRLLKRNEQLPHGVEVQFIEGAMSIPLIVVYPEFSQFDLIAKTGEEQKLSDSLQELFASPLPWDANGEYKEKDIEFFAQVEEAVLMKLPKDATIASVAARVPVKGAMEIIVLTNNKFAEFYKGQFKIY